MKLSMLFESRFTTRFHGTGSHENLLSILKNGLMGSDRHKMAYLAQIEIALKYSLWRGRGRDSNAYLVEVLLDLRSPTLHRDEDSFAVGEIPTHRIGDEFTTGSDEEWAKFFERWHPEFSQEDRDWIKKKAKKDPLLSDLSGIAQIMSRTPLLMPRGGTPGFRTGLNVGSTERITTEGPNRIVGGYVFDANEEERIAVCSKIVYLNGGSVKIGDKFEIAYELTA